MAKNALVIANNSGGQSGSTKEGPENSFAYSRHIDFRKDPNVITILPRTTRASGTTVTGLVTEMIQLPSGKKVAIDSSGGVYEVSTLGVWTKNATTLPSTACGMVYNLSQDTIYISGNLSIHSITNADARFGGTFTVNADAIYHNQDQASVAGHANTYTTTGSINEGATHKLSFTPTIEPLYLVKVWVTTKGSGDLVLTLHDAANNTLGTQTIANASITNGAYNTFTFSSTIRTTSGTNGSTYHFHLTHPSGTAHTIGCSTASSLATADYSTWATRLVHPTNGFHPIYQFLQYYMILNERYVAAWEPISQSEPSKTEFNQHRLTFPSGYECTSGAEYQEYFAIATEKRSADADNEYQTGKIFFWDGTSTTYNFTIDVPDGAPYGMYSSKNVLYYMAGGSWWAWSGGNPVKITQLPNTDTEYTDAGTYIVNYPHTMAIRNSILLAGFPSETSSTSIEHGIYSYGSRSRNYPDSLGYSYTISTGNMTNGTLRIGMVKSFGDKLYVSWRDASNYAVDIVDPHSEPFPTAVWESLIFDNERPDKEKEAVSYTLSFVDLPTGASVTPKYKIDRGDWVAGDTVTSGNTARININKRYREMQLGYTLAATTATPQLIAATFIFEDLASERD